MKFGRADDLIQKDAANGDGLRKLVMAWTHEWERFSE
jgi:hypothetical protein